MPVRYACLFPAEDPLFMEIEIPSDVRISTLLEAIEMKLHSRGRGDVKVNDLYLFKANVSIKPKETMQSRAIQWLHEQPFEKQLDETAALEEIFPDGPRPVKYHELDIIIADLEVLEMADGLGDSYAVFTKKIKKALDQRLNRFSLLPSPSEMIGSHDKLKEVFGRDKLHIHLGRPGGAPAVIFNPVLAGLQQDLDHLEQIEVDPEQVLRAVDYIRHVAEFRDEEKDMEILIKEVLGGAIGGTPKWGHRIDLDPPGSTGGKGRSLKPDASWWQEHFLILVLELKNSLGLHGDAIYQAVADYSKVVSGNEWKRFCGSCNFPIVLIGATANRLEISVAVYVGSFYVTKLLSLDLSLDFHASDNGIRLARVFVALSNCRISLQKYYLAIMSSKSPSISCLFPNPTPIESSKPWPNLIYRQFFSRAGQPTPDFVELVDTTTAMYTAILVLNDSDQDDSKLDVIVKFTAHYNEKAHSILANANLAPKLHFCGRIVGGLYMIVMDRVDGQSVWQLQNEPEQKSIPKIVASNIEKAVHLLHKEGIVFGDLRTNNILYVELAGKGHAVLVDFDWAGKDGESRYPGTLNRLGNAWHEDVGGYRIMRKAHDLWQLDRLKALCNSNI